MTARAQLSKYFDLIHRQSSLNSDEYQELLHLEEALVDNALELDQLREEKKNKTEPCS